MAEFVFLSVAQQAAQHLRGEILQGRWSGTIPGTPVLAAELGINHQTVKSALEQLEQEGLLAGQGAGRPRRILPLAEAKAVPQLRIGLLLWDEADRSYAYTLDLEHRLAMAGHAVIIPKQTLIGLKMEVPRVARVVEQNKADAWIVSAGSREVLEWFSRQNFPTFAIFGRYQNLPIAAVGPGKKSPIIPITKSLIQLGHRRIVMLVRRQHRLPDPGFGASAFLTTLKAHGIPDSPFWLPDWEETKEGFQGCLKELFRVTPPSALIVDEFGLYIAVGHFLGARGLRVPHDVSLATLQEVPETEWCEPAITHSRSDFSKLNRPVLRWAANISRGQRDIRQIAIEMEYVPGGTVGPAPVAEGRR